MEQKIFDKTPSHILTVGLDDYFQAEALKESIPRTHWYRFDSRLEVNSKRVLDLLDRFDTKATFFVMGWVAKRFPEIVQEVARRGHDIASQGYCRRNPRHMSPSELREDLSRSRAILEQVTGRRILGNRFGRPLLSPTDLWVLDVLTEQGYVYDSSVLPFLRSFRAEPWRRFAHRHLHAGRCLWEFPFSTLNCFGCLMPVAGGNYFRQIPESFIKYGFKRWIDSYSAPFVMYFHVWELDPHQPRIDSASLFARIRHYRNLGRTGNLVEEFLKLNRFESISDFLGIPSQETPHKTTKFVEPAIARITLRDDRPKKRTPEVSAENHDTKIPVTIVVPFFNEALNISYFVNTVRRLQIDLGQTYDLRFVFVDDGSTDETWSLLQENFSSNCRLLKLAQNRGVSAAIMCGLQSADTEIVCSIDSDCSYNPDQLRQMIPLLRDDVDLVTGSPYHPQGRVLNVPRWRLALSKAASLLYRRVIRQHMYTYTSCFRVYRRSSVSNVVLREGGFLGIPELIGHLHLNGCKCIECPAILEARMLGRSKMKLISVIAGHLRLMTRLMWLHPCASVKPHVVNVSEDSNASPIETSQIV